jgi:hypothetical protein
MMSARLRTILAAAATMAACGGAADAGPDSPALSTSAAEEASGLVHVTFPDADPGIPAYLRLSPMLDQFFHDGEWLAIPIYRSPECVPSDFNLLDAMHYPGPDGPGAFGCELLVRGSYLVERGAPEGTFPRSVSSTGDAVPIWFVRWAEFQAAAADGRVTLPDLAALPSLLRGTATRFDEMLFPREADHHVEIDARGTLEDGRSFTFHVTHALDRTERIEIAFR